MARAGKPAFWFGLSWSKGRSERPERRFPRCGLFQLRSGCDLPHRMASGGFLAEGNFLFQFILVMESISFSKLITPAPPGSALKVTTVYQDVWGSEWATELWCRVTQMMGSDAVIHTSWNLTELGRPVIFSEAVADAMIADVLVISIPAGEPLPAHLCAWIYAWLPRRRRRDGALIALLGMVPGQPDGLSKQAAEYLGAVARRGRLDFLLREHIEALNCLKTAAADSSPSPTTDSLPQPKRA